MDKLLTAMQDLRAVQAELSRKQRDYHDTVSRSDELGSRQVSSDLAALFKRSEAAFDNLRAQFARVENRTTAANDGDGR